MDAVGKNILLNHTTKMSKQTCQCLMNVLHSVINNKKNGRNHSDSAYYALHSVLNVITY